MRQEKLSEQEIAAELAKLPGWSVAGGKLRREFVCKDFVEAFGKMASVALVAEQMNHHPDWSNSWNKVTVELVTHSAGGLTALDFELAQKITKIFGG
jgi:4a-hydroxytetrahydrobiopterin dehydratase